MKALLDFFSLTVDPFSDTPDTSFLYSSATHREAFATLLWGINANRGFIGLTAKPGMGKTTLLFKLMSELNQSATTAFVFQTQADPDNMLRHLVADLGLSPEGNPAQIHAELNRFLKHQAKLGKRVILIVDEAQNLQDSVLEMLRLISDFETEQRKLVQFILSGQSQLAERLAKPSLEQLRQRIAAIARIEPFSENEVSRYLQHRLTIARYSGPQLFSDEAVQLIAKSGRGIPREINSIAFSALCIAYATRRRHIDADIVREAVSDRNLSVVSKQTETNPYTAATFAGSDSTTSPMKDRRAANRRGVDFQYVRSETNQVGLIVNIGPRGAALWVSAPDEWGDSQIQFRLPGTDLPLEIEGKVVWRRESQGLVGVLFSEISPDARVALESWAGSSQNVNSSPIPSDRTGSMGATEHTGSKESSPVADLGLDAGDDPSKVADKSTNSTSTESNRSANSSFSILNSAPRPRAKLLQRLWTSLVGSNLN